jgi:hypothetical protein
VLALEQAFQGGGVQLVAVLIDYSENTRVLVDELRKHGKEPTITLEAKAWLEIEFHSEGMSHELGRFGRS